MSAFGALLGQRALHTNHNSEVVTRRILAVRVDGWVQLGTDGLGGYSDSLPWICPQNYRVLERMRDDTNGDMQLPLLRGPPPDPTARPESPATPGPLPAPDRAFRPPPGDDATRVRSRSPVLTGSTKRLVWVGNLPPNIQLTRLRRDFATAGDLDEATVFPKKEHASATLLYSTPHGASEAVSHWHKSSYLGRTIRVELAKRQR
ncbi:unnamed protein product [Durusdinium trenchii]|uniref:RRM domain-containing protein n=1 Tax=Durusdinium trenchii TaxID=1381693 RepID=A0ABP0HDN4_9DINO